MRIVSKRLSYTLIEHNGKYFVMSRDSNENDSREFISLDEATKYFEKISNWIVEAQANAPSWD